MNHVVFILKTFIFIIITSHTLETEYIDGILNVLEEMAENNLNRSLKHKLSPHKYLVLLAEDDEEAASEGASKDGKLLRRQGPSNSNRMPPSHRDEKKKAEKVREQHLARMRTVINFMEHHYMTTVYLLDEVERIKRQRQVMDRLRRMVYYLELPGNEEAQDRVLKCYQAERLAKTLEFDIWKGRKPNNLIINILKDPENDGVIN